MTPDADTPRARCTLIAGVVLAPLALITLVTFWPALDGEFLNWDDTVNYVRNESFRGAGPSAWAWSWRANTLGVYQPVSWMIAGAVTGAGGESAERLHAASLVTHAITAMLCAMLFVQLLDARFPRTPSEPGGGRWIAAGAATAAYALHPLRAETVAWASALPYELAAMFAVASVIAYLRAVERPGALRWGWFATSVALSAAAMFSKSAAVALPIVLLVLDAYPLRRFSAAAPKRGRIAMEKLPFAVIAVVAMIGAVWASSSTERTVDAGSATGRIALAAYGLAFAATRTIVPLGLSPYYPRPVTMNPLDARFLVAGAIVVVVSAVLLMGRRRVPGLTAAWAAYLVVLLPAVGVVQHGHQLTADRYATLSTIGLFAAAAGGLWQTRRSHVGSTILCAALFAVLGLAMMTWQRAHHWHDSISMWGRVVQRHPDSYFARKSLAGAYSDGGDFAAAERELRASLELHPAFGLTHYDLGVLLLDRGDVEGAICAFRRAAELVPTFSGAHYNLGVALASAGRFQESAAALSNASELSPTDLPTLNNLGAVLVELGRPRDAVAVLTEAAALAPATADLQFNLGNALTAADERAAAMDAYERALALDPGHGDAAVNVARLAMERGEWRRAIDVLTAARERSATHDGVALTLAWSLLNAPDASLRNVQAAADLAADVCRRTQNQDPQAVELLQSAVRAGAAGR